MKDFALILPEVYLAITLAGILLSETGYHGERTRLVSFTALMGLAGAFVQTLLTYLYPATQIFGQAMTIDGLALFFKLFAIVLSAFAIVASMYTQEISKERRAEYSALIIGSALAMCVAASASDILLAFLSLQLLNILGYFLAAFSKKSVHSTEAAVKYLAFGSVAGALLLYGVAILYASTHAIGISEMHRFLVATPLTRDTALVVFMLMFLSFCFQFGAFPMFLWAPDVLEGSPTPVSAYLSVAPRAAGFAVALRFFITLFAQPALVPGQWEIVGGFDWPQIVALVAGITMITGSLLAYRQTGAKRLVAYLVVAEAGYLLLGLLVLDQVGIAALLYNLVVELFALMGAYTILSFLYDELKSDRLDHLRGMLGRAVPECVCLILFLACLVGIPPLPGFIGKFALIGAAIRHHWYFLAILAILSSAIATAAVARLAYALIKDFRTNTALSPVTHDPKRRAFMAALFVPMILVGIFAEWVLTWAGQSLRFILW